ncbi:T9SS type A sorting domain-containing protein [Arcticibacterium luteifluviistationis]|uniref:Secretion system C-terminal sorting domain-containing protein n=1 Tax=Arcticibacterium luteifluviistationis TaxID=1784714 RepID=A0A2Z4GI73_9BACT|nr:hypothetical protein DJ013_21575 [Arcticibacterium luteifluviistationis]
MAIETSEKLNTNTIKLKEDINPGVYFLKLHTKENSWTKRLVVF